MSFKLIQWFIREEATNRQFPLPLKYLRRVSPEAAKEIGYGIIVRDRLAVLLSSSCSSSTNKYVVYLMVGLVVLS